MSNTNAGNPGESSEPTDASDGDTRSDESDVLDPLDGNETVNPETRETVLAKYNHRCQACGRRGPKEGGLATLHVHHIDRDPAGMDVHDLRNLTLMCRMCHEWFHLKHSSADAPLELTDEDERVLLSQDIEILRYLEQHGPARTGDIASGLSSNHSVTSVRERLWVLMGLDNLVESRDRQIVDQEVETGEWGLTPQIETSARGHIPDNPQLLLQRAEDEQVLQALDRGCDRHVISDVLDVTRRTTFNKHKRAAAYDFPLDAITRVGRPTDADRAKRDSTATDSSTDQEDTQERFDTVSEQDPDSSGRTETWGTTETTPETGVSNGSVKSVNQGVSENGSDDDLRVHLQHAFDALREVEQEL